MARIVVLNNSHRYFYLWLTKNHWADVSKNSRYTGTTMSRKALRNERHVRARLPIDAAEPWSESVVTRVSANPKQIGVGRVGADKSREERVVPSWTGSEHAGLKDLCFRCRVGQVAQRPAWSGSAKISRKRGKGSLQGAVGEQGMSDAWREGEGPCVVAEVAVECVRRDRAG